MSDENRNIFETLLKQSEETKKQVKYPSKDYIKRIDNLIANSIKFIIENNYEYPANYKNSKGLIKQLDISKHAIDRFEKRLNKVYNKNKIDLTKIKLEQLLCYMINSSVRENMNKCKTLSNRRKKYGEDNASIYLKFGCFRFIIENKIIVTVELRVFYTHLNKE